MTIDGSTLIAELLRHPWAEEVLRWHGVHSKLYPGLPVDALAFTAGIDVERLLVDLRAAARSLDLEHEGLLDDPWTAELYPPQTPPPAPPRVL